MSASVTGGAPIAAWSVALSLMLTNSLAAETLESRDRQTGCRLSVPKPWQGLTIHWSGACPQGRASGIGVLRAYDGPRLRAAFYGELANGTWSFGVLDNQGSYAAGHFRNTEAISGADRNVLIDAFDVASGAARALADDFAAKGNAASAEHYRRKAKALAEVLD